MLKNQIYDMCVYWKGWEWKDENLKNTWFYRFLLLLFLFFRSYLGRWGDKKAWLVAVPGFLWLGDILTSKRQCNSVSHVTVPSLEVICFVQKLSALSRASVGHIVRYGSGGPQHFQGVLNIPQCILVFVHWINRLVGWELMGYPSPKTLSTAWKVLPLKNR